MSRRAIARDLVRRPATAVWVGLVLATLVSWALGHHDRGSDGARVPTSLLVLVIAVTKGRFVAAFFMEDRTAPPVLRRLLDAYFVVALVVLVGTYLAGGT